MKKIKIATVFIEYRDQGKRKFNREVKKCVKIADHVNLDDMESVKTYCRERILLNNLNNADRYGRIWSVRVEEAIDVDGEFYLPIDRDIHS